MELQKDEFLRNVECLRGTTCIIGFIRWSKAKDFHVNQWYPGFNTLKLCNRGGMHVAFVDYEFFGVPLEIKLIVARR
ncbi:unnamed protein product [Lactuca virosa]|uniref:Uncharacterized protein n=1 Tax=Lactuca virosa TaxID=75947 RepID=A0AAU9PLS6_9ASTR|nr:unnamed protein product [Lactuca virosa]